MTIITLVHGTFAKNADWTQASSPLACALQKSVEGEVLIKSVNWSGHNLHLSRYKAAKILGNHIKSLSEEYPGCRQFVIAHSHGGNVAMYALNDPSVWVVTQGLITLSTPFILCRPRTIMPGILALFMSMVFLAPFVYLGLNTNANPYLVLASVFLISSLMIFGERRISKFVLGRPGGKPSEIFLQLKESFVLPALPTSKLLIVRAPGDEASAALGASTFGTWLFGRISNSMAAIKRLSDWMRGIKRSWSLWKQLICSLGILVAGIGIVALAAKFMGPGHSEVWPGYAFGFGCATVILALSFWFPFALDTPEASGLDFWALGLLYAYAFAVAPFLLMASLFSAAFGWDLALLASWFEMTVETSPVGRFLVLSLSSPSTRGLWHSLPYSDAEAFEAIVNWINSAKIGAPQSST